MVLCWPPTCLRIGRRVHHPSGRGCAGSGVGYKKEGGEKREAKGEESAERPSKFKRRLPFLLSHLRSVATKPNLRSDKREQKSSLQQGSVSQSSQSPVTARFNSP